MHSKAALQQLFRYCFGFLLCYCLFYYGTLFITGLTVPGGYYSGFVQQYFDYPAAFRKLLLYVTRWLLQAMGHNAEVSDMYHVRIKNATGVKVVYSCLGTGVLSFWAAFIVANKCVFKRKLLYIVTGLGFIFFLNALRLALLVVAANFTSGKNTFFVHNHHLFFNIACYTLIVLMMVAYDQLEKKYNKSKPAKPTVLTN